VIQVMELWLSPANPPLPIPESPPIRHQGMTLLSAVGLTGEKLNVPLSFLI
jgi:hypothetical protein